MPKTQFMGRLFALLFLLFCATPQASFAQRDKEDRKEEQEERKAASRDKVHYSVFRRQILTLPEFSEQRGKLAQLRKEGKGIAKIYAVVDSNNDNADNKMITGYITLAMGDNLVNVYEVTYDRSLKQIILVKATGETLEVEKAEPAEKKEMKTAPPRPGKKPVPKRKRTDDEEDEEEEPEEDEEEERPVRGKKKDRDEEED